MPNSRIWYRAPLSAEQRSSGQLDAIRHRFMEAVAKAGAPAGACLFATWDETSAPGGHDDAGEVNADAVYFSPASISAVPRLISEYAAEPSEPPDRGRAALLVGQPSDWDLLPRSSH